MLQEIYDLDAQKKVRCISESSNASTSGYSTNGGGGGVFPPGNSSPTSSIFSMPSSPMSPATVLQAEFPKINLTSNSPQQQHQQQQQRYFQQANALHGSPAAATVAYNANYINYINPSTMLNGTIIHEAQFDQDNAMGVKQEFPAELKILEHPVEKFRFRYKSEMHGTHGSLNGANSKRSPKTYPEVALRHYNGRAIIRCSLFQTNIESPHSHQLVVRKDETDICDPHDLEVSPEKGFVAQFQNMGIIHTAKKFIFDELLKKKKNRLCFELGRDELSTKQIQELHRETEKEAKDMNLNQVRLCFEAFKVEENGSWSRIAAPVFTNPINNRKSAQTGELRICRLSIVTGRVTGDDDLILLVEKVSKKNIKVRFFELNEDEECVWEAFGKFRESDVHHQYAIVCQTPPYRNKDIEKPVDVCVELVRPSDDERSEPPLAFRYKPRDIVISRKRRRTCSTATSGSSSGNSLSSLELPKTLREQPIPNAPNTAQAGTIATGNFYQTHQMVEFCGNSAPTISEEFNKDQQLNALLDNPTFNYVIGKNSEELSKICITSDLDFNFDDFPLDDLPKGGKLQKDGPSSSSSTSPLALVQRRLSEQQQTSEQRKRLLRHVMANVDANNNVHLTRIFKLYDETVKLQSPHQAQVEAMIKSIEAIYSEYAEKNEHGDTILHEVIFMDNHKAASKLCLILKSCKLEQLFNRYNANNETALHCACLNDRPQYIRPLLNLGCDANVQDGDGNTALHVAIKEHHKKCVDSFLMSDKVRLNLSLANDEGLSPVHLAIRLQAYDIVEKLLEHDRSGALVPTKKEGNNALHMAVLQQNLDLIKIILNGQNISDLLKQRNTGGQTAIDLARNICGKSESETLQFLLSQCEDVDDMLAIKEEEVTSSSTDEDDDNSQYSEEMRTMKIKTEPEDADEAGMDTMVCQQDLCELLSDKQKFLRLAEKLNETDKWRRVANGAKLGHFNVLWKNAEHMLKYIKSNAKQIEYRVFMAALEDVDKTAAQILRS